jgi:protein-L-isoaspartate O-methyltransferase
MTETLGVKSSDKVLEIGTGSGERLTSMGYHNRKALLSIAFF